MTILLTGFPPYADAERNPSEEIVTALAGTVVGGVEVVGRMLPVSAERTRIISRKSGGTIICSDSPVVRAAR